MKTYRKGVGIFLLNKNNKLWVGKRIDFKSDYWQMPQGGIDKNESPQDAMMRELSEEVGIKKNYEILKESKGWLSYNLPQSLKKNLKWKSSKNQEGLVEECQLDKKLHFFSIMELNFLK